MATERRYSGVEVRAEGRRLIGPALVYGDVSPSHRERFEPGAFVLGTGTRYLDVEHDQDRVIAHTAGGGLTLRDTPEALMVEAVLPDIPLANKALDDVRAKRLRGFSIEFAALAETRDASGIRVVCRAELPGIGLVGSPSYPLSRVEARQRSGRVMRSRIPYNKTLACDCIAKGGAGSACVAAAKFSRHAGDLMAEAFNEANREVLAIAGNYRRPLGSASRGTVRANSTADGLEIEIDLPAGAIGDEVIAANETAGVIIRPLIDMSRSEFVDTPTGREYRRPHLRALIVGSTDARGGWPDVTIEDVLDVPPRGAAAMARALSKMSRRRRVWL